MIEVEGLTKYYGEHAAIRDLTFSIRTGEVIGFLGLNGAGKSTSLRILGCVLLPTSGRVVIDGIDVTVDPHEVRKRIGFLPDVPPVYPEMTVGDYLGYVAQLRGVPSRDVASRVADAERKTALVEAHDEIIGSLSHGFRQRVGVAQALVHNPALLVLDEPASGLDPEQIVEMRALIRSLRGAHTILLSSHNLPEVSQTCDRLLVIEQGVLVAQGTEQELVQRAVGGHGRVEIEVPREQAHAVAPALAGLAEVTAVLQEPNDAAVARFGLETSGEARARIVRALVAANVDVLRVDRAAFALESIFLKLTRAHHVHAGAGGGAQ